MENTEEKLKEAVATYNKIAEIYAKYTEDKLVQFQLTRFESMLPGKKILDAGCGAGRDMMDFMADGFEVVGIDISEGLLKEAKKRVPNGKFKLGDFRKMTFRKSTFDGVWAMASLFHLPKKDILTTLNEFNRVLKPRGILYVSVRRGTGIKEDKKERYKNEPRTIFLYEKQEMEDLLREAGFKILAAEANDVWVEVFAEKKE